MTTSPSPTQPAPLSGVREAVRRTPAYPFTAIDAPIKLDQNESAQDLPPELRALALERLATQSWNRYPDLHADTLRHKIAAFEDWDPEGVVVTPGSNVLIKLLTELAGLHQTVLSVQPTFSVYTLESSLLGAKTVLVPLNPDFSLPVEALSAELRGGGPGPAVRDPAARAHRPPRRRGQRDSGAGRRRRGLDRCAGRGVPPVLGVGWPRSGARA